MHAPRPSMALLALLLTILLAACGSQAPAVDPYMENTGVNQLATVTPVPPTPIVLNNPSNSLWEIKAGQFIVVRVGEKKFHVKPLMSRAEDKMTGMDIMVIEPSTEDGELYNQEVQVRDGIAISGLLGMQLVANPDRTITAQTELYTHVEGVYDDIGFDGVDQHIDVLTSESVVVTTPEFKVLMMPMRSGGNFTEISWQVLEVYGPTTELRRADFIFGAGDVSFSSERLGIEMSIHGPSEEQRRIRVRWKEFAKVNVEQESVVRP